MVDLTRLKEATAELLSQTLTDNPGLKVSPRTEEDPRDGKIHLSNLRQLTQELSTIGFPLEGLDGIEE